MAPNSVAEHRRPAMRVAVWFLLLSSIPVVVLAIFLRQAVDHAFVEYFASRQHDTLVSIAEISMTASESNPDQLLPYVPLDEGQLAFILQPDGSYKQHTNPENAETEAGDDYGSAVISQILFQKNGIRADAATESVFAFTPIGAQGDILVLVTERKTISPNLVKFQTVSVLQLAFGVLLIAGAGGAAVWIAGGLPSRSRKETPTHQMGEQELQVKTQDVIDDLGGLASAFNHMASRASQQIRAAAIDLEAKEDMIDEVTILAAAFNKMASSVEGLIAGLKQRVAARTRDLEIAASVSREASTVLDIAELLPKLARLTREGFGLYSVSIFLHDESHKLLRRAASAGEGGQQESTESIELRIDALTGLVVKAARERRAIIVNDINLSQDFVATPLLPDTRSEIALPMIMGGNLIGVLDLQSKQSNRFVEFEVEILTSLAEQIAIAVRNAYHVQALEEARAEAEESRKQAEQADQVKSQFLASMSHELRTPLNAIMSFTKLMAMEAFGEVNEEQASYLEKILQSCRHLLSLINDVLDISKFQSGVVELFIEHDFDVAQEFETLASSTEKLLLDKPVKLIRDIERDLPTLSCDKRRIRQVIYNLISNASKFTEQGSITLCAKTEGEYVILGVLDTGPGISLEEQEMIFEPFIQTEVGIQHGGGTGLGLPICKSIVEAHGGYLIIKSKPGEGAAFYAKIPLRNGVGMQKPEAAAPVSSI